MAAQVLRLAREERLELPPVAERVQLDERASATVMALRKEQDMDLCEALSFIVNDWAAMKLRALEAVPRA